MSNLRQIFWRSPKTFFLTGTATVLGVFRICVCDGWKWRCDAPWTVVKTASKRFNQQRLQSPANSRSELSMVLPRVGVLIHSQESPPSWQTPSIAHTVAYMWGLVWAVQTTHREAMTFVVPVKSTYRKRCSNTRTCPRKTRMGIS